MLFCAYGNIVWNRIFNIVMIYMMYANLSLIMLFICSFCSIVSFFRSVYSAPKHGYLFISSFRLSIKLVHESIIFAGLPTARLSSGISWVTTEPAPITTLSPIYTPGSIIVPAPIKTLLPICTIPIFT